MRAVILSRMPSLYATRRLAEEGRNLKIKIKIVDTLRLSVLLSDSGDKIFYRNEEMKIPDVVIPRIGATITAFGGCIMFQLEQMKIPLVNSSEGMFNSRDKFRCGQILSSRGLPTPRTMVLRRPSKKDVGDVDPMARKVLNKERAAKAIEMIGGPPVIFKLNKGTQGVGIVLCNTINEVYAQLDMLWKSKEDFILQEFVKESKGVDVRALVVGGEVVASMKRESKTGDFRSNTHQGGEVSAYELPEDVRNIAVRAAAAVGLNVAGVDMLIGSNDYKIIEINSSPGFEGLEKATRKNVARRIMRYAMHLGKARKAEVKINGNHNPVMQPVNQSEVQA